MLCAKNESSTLKFQNKIFVGQIWKPAPFLALQGPFLELHECPVAAGLILGPITASQNATTITIKIMVFNFTPQFCVCGAKLWTSLTLSHAKSIGVAKTLWPTNFFSGGYTFYRVLCQNIYHIFVDGMPSDPALACPLRNMSNHSRTPHPTLPNILYIIYTKFSSV